VTKPLLLFMGPIQSRSGYGDHSRDIISAIIKSNEYDVKIIPINWGSTPLNVLTETDDYDILSKILNDSKLSKQPDIFVHLTVPNEFKRLGKYNIGITAGIETTICSVSWLEGLNKMDKIIVPSKFSKDVFLKTGYTKKTNGKEVGTLTCTSPIDVLFEGVDTNIFKKITSLKTNVRRTLNNIDNNFLFLFVGHWLNGDLGHDRKDVGLLIKTFLSTFKNKNKQPGLLLKTGNNFSYREEANLLNKINNIKQSFKSTDKLPKIYLLHGNLTKEEMNELYNHQKVKAHVTFTKGEGFGRPLLEASMSAKPIISSNWGGQLDFLNPNFAVLLPGKLQQVHKSAVWENVIIPESSWYYINYTYASSVLLDVYNNYNNYTHNATLLYNENKNKFNLTLMEEKLIKLLDNIEKNNNESEIIIPKLPKLKLKEDK